MGSAIPSWESKYGWLHTQKNDSKSKAIYHGGLAQLGERFAGSDAVRASIPLTSTMTRVCPKSPYLIFVKVAGITAVAINVILVK
jgi:hypothetical protein